MKTCVIWDLDGTLAHARGIWSQALLHAAQKVLPRRLWPDIDSLKAANRGRYIWYSPFEDNRAFINEAFWEEMFRSFFLACRLWACRPRPPCGPCPISGSIYSIWAIIPFTPTSKRF